jgi:MerR family transcriptional regulator, thiopeptide resistance regulator
MKTDESITIGELARRFGISRATLLYYESTGILVPGARTASGYRVYTEADAGRLAKIRMFREAGMAVAQIGPMLGDDTGTLALERRLEEINREMAALREQQRVLLSLLGPDGTRARSRTMDKETWLAVLHEAGLDDEGARDWHESFEGTAPEAHEDFLESLGLSPAEVAAIRLESRKRRGGEA